MEIQFFTFFSKPATYIFGTPIVILLPRSLQILNQNFLKKLIK